MIRFNNSPGTLTIADVDIPIRVTSLDIQQDVIDLGPGSVPVARDVTDGAGHRHRWGKRGHPSTLTVATVHHDCDGACGDSGCDGWDDVIYRCSQCAAEVERPLGYEASRVVAGPRTATVEYAITPKVLGSLPGDTLNRLMSVNEPARLRTEGLDVDVLTTETTWSPDGVSARAVVTGERK